MPHTRAFLGRAVRLSSASIPGASLRQLSILAVLASPLRISTDFVSISGATRTAKRGQVGSLALRPVFARPITHFLERVSRRVGAGR